MVEMGHDRDLVRALLNAACDDPDLALDFLFDNLPMDALNRIASSICSSSSW